MLPNGPWPFRLEDPDRIVYQDEPISRNGIVVGRGDIRYVRPHLRGLPADAVHRP